MGNVMIDLETMSTGENAAIVSIGAVRIEKIDGEYATTDTFYRNVSLEDSVRRGLEMDASTVIWWLQQSKDAQQEIISSNKLEDVLLDFIREFLKDDDVVWGNGADFDNKILANAYKKCGLSVPWKWSNNRCYRTLKNMHTDVKLVRKGTHHNALDDAVSQAEHLCAICNKHVLMI